MDIGKKATRTRLDDGTAAANDKHFWVRVQEAFVDGTPNKVYDKFVYPSNPHYLEEDEEEGKVVEAWKKFDPSKIVPHEWQKLCAFWKTVNLEYKGAFARFTTSGHHNKDFFNFCYGRLDTFYLQKKLTERPSLNGFVKGTLPEGCAVSSNDVIDVTIASVPSSSSRANSNKNSQKKRKKSDPEDGKDKDREAVGAITCVLEGMQESLQQATSVLQVQMLGLKTFFEGESRKTRYDEWADMGNCIRKLNALLNSNDVDESEKADLWDEVEYLKKRRAIMQVAMDRV